MPRHSWPTVQELGARLGMNANNLRRHAAALAKSNQAFKSRSATGQTCWRVKPDALARRVGRPLKAVRQVPAASAKPHAAEPLGVPITVTIHIPDKLLRRLFGSGSKGT